MQLTILQYNALMQAINNAKGELLADTFIDYNDAETPAWWTNENITNALEEIEEMIIRDSIPF